MNAALASHFWAGLALWCLGQPDQALEPMRAALRVAGGSQLIFMQAACHGQMAQLHHFRREIEPLIEHADAALGISERQGYPFHHAVALMLRGWADVMTGSVEPGLDRIRRGLAFQDAAGADIERPYGLGLLADALLHAGRIDEGLAATDDGLATLARRALTFFWEAELHRLRGELLLRRGDAAEGEAALRAALDVARRQDAFALQLRAAMSLCALEERTGGPAATRNQRDHEAGSGRAGSARHLLADLYARFTEGLDTPDLRDAAGLLAAAG